MWVKISAYLLITDEIAIRFFSPRQSRRFTLPKQQQKGCAPTHNPFLTHDDREPILTRAHIPLHHLLQQVLLLQSLHWYIPT